MSAEWDDLARLAEAAPVQQLRVGAEGSEGSRVNPDTGDKRTDVRAVLVVNGLGQPEDGRMARFIAAANPATILRLITALREAQETAERVVARRRTEAEAERDAIAQDLAQVAWEREQYKLAAEATSNDRVVLRVRLAAVEDERGSLAARLAAAEALRDHWAVMAGTAIDPDTREWLDAASRDLRAVLATPTTPSGGEPL